jgi:hypothetical protein
VEENNRFLKVTKTVSHKFKEHIWGQIRSEMNCIIKELAKRKEQSIEPCVSVNVNRDN